MNTDRTPQGDDSSSDPSTGNGWYGHFGACLVSPDNHDYEKRWDTYHQLIQKKVAINIAHYDEMPVSKEVREFTTNLSLISPILTSWNAIQGFSWTKKMNAYKNFVELTSSAAYVYALRDENFVSRMQDPDFINDYNSPNDDTFRKNFNIILATMRDSDAQAAMTYFHRMHLIFVDSAGLKSALALANFFHLAVPAGKEGDSDALNEVNEASNDLNYTPFMKGIKTPPTPKNSSDNFSEAYWSILKASISNFLENNRTSQEVLNNLVSPDVTIPYDDFVVASHGNDEQVGFTKNVFGKDHQIGVHEIIAIDGVARTLWGEARSCDAVRGAHGYSAVGLVMANRTVAVQNSLDEKSSVREQNKAIEQKDVDYLMDSDATNSLLGFVPEKSLGQADFGRKGSLELAASQIVSRPEQFSCWNGYNTHTVRLSSLARLPQGMPDFEYTFKTPKDANDQEALVNVLCPQINPNSRQGAGALSWNTSFPASYDESWQTAVDLATLIVLDPLLYKQLYHFSPVPKSAPLFYTNSGVTLPGDPVLSVQGMTYRDPDTGRTESFSGGTHCNDLKVYSARSRTVYGVSP
jgi:hypothetical protein